MIAGMRLRLSLMIAMCALSLACLISEDPPITDCSPELVIFKSSPGSIVGEESLLIVACRGVASTLSEGDVASLKRLAEQKDSSRKPGDVRTEADPRATLKGSYEVDLEDIGIVRVLVVSHR